MGNNEKRVSFTAFFADQLKTETEEELAALSKKRHVLVKLINKEINQIFKEESGYQQAVKSKDYELDGKIYEARLILLPRVPNPPYFKLSWSDKDPENNISVNFLIFPEKNTINKFDEFSLTQEKVDDLPTLTAIRNLLRNLSQKKE